MTMNTAIQGQLDRIETALTTLVDSIASYNPSIPAASNLLQADVELQDGLQKLQTHAQNTARINSLRNTIARQNDLITSHLTLLAETRNDLLSIPSSSTSLPGALSPESQERQRQDVTYTELLSYAKHIARFTTAPVGAFRSRSGGGGGGDDTTTTATAAAPAADAKTPKPDPQAPAASGGADTGPQATPVEKPASPIAVEAGTKDGRGIADLNQWEKQWLDPWTGILVTPWPGEDVLKRGGLAELQAIVEKGGTVDVDEGTVKVEEPGGGGGGGDDDEKGVETADGMDVDLGAVAAPKKEALENGHSQGVAQANAVVEKEEKPKVFGGLDLYDPDEEG